MAIDTTSPRSRRALLAGAVGGVAALAAHALGRPLPADAATGGNMLLGQANAASEATSIRNPTINNSTTSAYFATGATGVHGNSSVMDGLGVVGAVNGSSGRAVQGFTSGHYSQIAVDGDTTGGVGEGISVRGRTKNGIAIQAIATGGHALNVAGRAVFSRSGKVTFSAGQSSRTVFGHVMETNSIVLATIQGNVAGTFVRGVSTSVANDTFTIRLNKAAPSSLTVGYWIVN